MSAQGEHEVARMTNWSQRVNKEIQGALDWYKEWGIIFQQENNAKPPSLDQLIRQKEAELRKVDKQIAQVKAEIEENALTADAEKKFGKFGFGVKRAQELHPAI
eukprot:INCI1717.1.p2 GENE.INCI1717.1~~INCI1717.1.p2  ORF type:complete len:104 (-),score=25.16 INCI1717.1:377-688(-)